MAHYIMPYAFGLTKDGKPDTETAARLDKAYSLAERKGKKTIIFLGAGMQAYAQTKGAYSLATPMRAYLRTKTWPIDRIKVYSKGYDTVTETLSFQQFLMQHTAGDLTMVETATSWWHVPRVRMICRIIFGTSIKVHPAPTTHSIFRLAYDIVREVGAFPPSAFRAWRVSKNISI